MEKTVVTDNPMKDISEEQTQGILPKERKHHHSSHHHHHHHHHHHRPNSWWGEALFLGSIATGIYVFFLMFGFYQEKIYSLVHPESGEKFSFFCFLVLITCCSNAAFSLLLLLIQHHRHPMQRLSIHALQQTALVSLSYCGSMVFTNSALTKVNYPTQILVKSAKAVPVVLGGFLFFGKTYPIIDYISVAVITTSLFIFQMAKLPSGTTASSSSVEGIVYLCLSLLCDGLTGPRQDKLLAREKHLNPLMLMFFTNLFSCIWLSALTVITEGLRPLHFVSDHPEALGFVVAFAVFGSVGQLFIYQSLKYLGSLYTSLLTTVRKAASTVFSVYWFGHKLAPAQWAAFSAIFVMMLAQTLIKKRSGQAKKACVEKSAKAL